VRRYMLRNPAGDQAPLYLLPGLEVEISASEIREHCEFESNGGFVCKCGLGTKCESGSRFRIVS